MSMENIRELFLEDETLEVPGRNLTRYCRDCSAA